MSARHNYVYGQTETSRSRHLILLGLVIVDVIGYKEKKYHPNWKRIALFSPFAILLFWVSFSEVMYFREKHIFNIKTTRREDMYVYMYDIIVDGITNFFLSKESVKKRHKAIVINAKNTYGRAAHLQRKGEHFISIAKTAIERLDHSEFAKFIGTGSRLSPTNLDAQRLFINLLFAIQRTIDAFKLMEETLEYAYNDSDYFNFYIKKCLEYDQDASIITTAKRHINQSGLDPQIRKDLIFVMAQSYYLRGDYETAEDIIRDHQLYKTEAGIILYCKLLWDKGNKREAMQELNSAIELYPTSYRLLEVKAPWLKEMNEIEAAKDCVDLLIISVPNNPNSVIEYTNSQIMYMHLIPGEKNLAKRTEIIDQLILNYGHNEEVMLNLARFGNDIVDCDLTQKMLDYAKNRRFTNCTRFELVHVECLLNAGRVRETILLIDALYAQSEKDNWVIDIQIAFEAIRTIAFFADKQNELGLSSLHMLLRNRYIHPKILISVSKKLVDAKYYVEANEVLIIAHLQHETNQSVLMHIVRLKLENPEISGDLEVYLRRLMENRRPPQTILSAAFRRLNSDTFLFSQNRKPLIDDVAAKITKEPALPVVR